MKKLFLALICFILLFTYDSLAQNKLEKKGISPNFPNFKGVLLVEKCSYKLIERALDNRFKKFYKGEIEMIGCDDLKKDSYKDAPNLSFCNKNC